MPSGGDEVAPARPSKITGGVLLCTGVRNDDVASHPCRTDLSVLRKCGRCSWRARAVAPSLFKAPYSERPSAVLRRRRKGPCPRGHASKSHPPPKKNDVRLEPPESVWASPNHGFLTSSASVLRPQGRGFSSADRLLTALSRVPAVCSVGDLEGRSEGLKTSVSLREEGAGGRFLSF